MARSTAALLAVIALAVGSTPAHAAPTADFTFSPESPVTDETVTFTSNATGADPVSHAWDFDGDAIVDATGKQVQTSYKDAGTYTVTLYVSDPDGKAEASRQVIVRSPGEPPPPPPPGGPPPQEPSPANVPPSAVLQVATATPTAGSAVAFDASPSRDSDGAIVAYEWDWNADGRFDANTGTRPTARFPFGTPGGREVRLRITDDDGAASVDTMVVTVAEPPPGCLSTADVAFIRVIAPCLRRDGNTYIAETSATDNEINMGGVSFLATPGRVSRIEFDTRRLRATSTERFSLQLNNTPVGDIVMWRGVLSFGLPDFTGGVRGAQSAPERSVRLFTFSAGSGCEAAERTVCARLPGGFPVRGQIDLYATDDFQMVFDAYAELTRPLTVRGNVRLRTSTDRGFHLDELGFRIRNANLGAFRLDNLSFRYQAPPTDTWDAELRVILPTPTEAGVAGRLRFVRGSFNFLSAELTGAEVPVGPGVFLNRFRGDFGIDPFRIGGGLGARFGPATANANFLLEDTVPSHLRVDGNFSLYRQELARARFDLWSNGDLDFEGEFHFAYPPPPVPNDLALYRVDGNVAGWFQNPRFEVSGGVRLRAWIIDAQARVLVNNDWIAGCAGLATPVGNIDGRAAIRLRDGAAEFGFGCDLGPYRIARLRASGSAGERSFDVPRDLPAVGLELASPEGAPSVTLQGPGGERFTISAPSGEVVRSGPFTAVRTEDDHRLIVRIDRPAAGTWRVVPEEGAPGVSSLRTAAGLPDPDVETRVTGTGTERRLEYSLRPIRGQRVRFVEDGSDTTHAIGTATGARGSIPFTPHDGTGRVRRIVAVVEQDGIPRETTAVGRYTAPPAVRPRRPGRARIRRRGTTVTVTWGAASGADRYAVTVTGSDGRREVHRTTARRRRLVLTGIQPFERLILAIRGEHGADGRSGPARGARLAARPGARR